MSLQSVYSNLPIGWKETKQDDMCALPLQEEERRSTEDKQKPDHLVFQELLKAAQAFDEIYKTELAKFNKSKKTIKTDAKLQKSDKAVEELDELLYKLQLEITERPSSIDKMLLSIFGFIFW